MNVLSRSIMSVLAGVLFVASAVTVGLAATTAQQPVTKMQTITGEVTPSSGLISNKCKPYLLYGSKAAGLRKYVNREVEVQGYLKTEGKSNAITVESFKPVGTTHLAMNKCSYSYSKSDRTKKPAEVSKPLEMNKPSVAQTPAAEPAK